MGLIDRVKKIEKNHKVSQYIPVLILDDEEELDSCKHLVGPYTVVIIDDIHEDVEVIPQ